MACPVGVPDREEVSNWEGVLWFIFESTGF